MEHAPVHLHDELWDLARYASTTKVQLFCPLTASGISACCGRCIKVLKQLRKSTAEQNYFSIEISGLALQTM